MRRISTMDISSMMTASAFMGLSSFRWKASSLSSPKPYSSRRCMVLASRPVASVMRFAARPVGAASSAFRPSSSSKSIIQLIAVVFPVPGPPVITVTPCCIAWITASRCWSARLIWFFSSNRRILYSRSLNCRIERSAAKSISIRAVPASAW